MITAPKVAFMSRSIRKRLSITDMDWTWAPDMPKARRSPTAATTRGGAIDVATAVNAHGGPCGRMDFESETFVCHGTQDPDVLRNLAHPLGRNHGQENAVCVTGHTTHALTSEGFDASEDGTGRGNPIVATALRARDAAKGVDSDCTDTLLPMRAGVRRLTPTECERLQGFPDGHTLVPHRGKPMADGPRYRCLGNSMAVPVMAWIGRRIQAALEALP